MRWAYSSSSVTGGLLREELADRFPDIVLRGDVAGADREPRALQLGEDLGELRVARAEGGDAAGLAIAGVVHLGGDLGERGARFVAVLGGVLAVRGVEEVDVVAARIVARAHDLEGEARHRRGDRAAARGGLEELALVELPRLRRMREEHRLDLGVLAADALQREEEELLREPPLRFVHRARDVEREDHRGAGGGRGPAHELPEAQVVVHQRDRLVVDRRGLDGVALHRLLHGAPAVEARARAALVPAFAHVLVLVHGSGALGLELGELQLLPEPVDDLVDLELDDEADLAFAGAPLAPLRVAFLAPGLQDVAGLALALARALVHLRVGEAKPRMLQELYRHGDRAG